MCYGGHPYKMEKLGLDLDDGSSPADQKQVNPQEARKLTIERCIQSLVDACQCRDANCRLLSCQKMKRVMQHTKICKRKANGDCPICKQLIALCCYHAKYCQESKCLVPFCKHIKYRMKEQQLQARLQEAQLLRRHMAVMNIRRFAAVMGSAAVSPGAPQAVVMPAPGPPHQPGIGLKPGTQTPPANVLQETKCPVPFCKNIKYKMKQQQLQARLQQAQLLRRRMALMNTRRSAAVMGSAAVSPGAPQTVVMPAPGPPHQPGIGLKPGTQIPPANVLQVIKQAQEEAARQQAPHAAVGNVNPVVPQVMPPSPTPLLPMDQWPNSKSSMAMLNLTTQGKAWLVFLCDGCKGQVETCYSCTLCNDFNFCVPCFKKSGHPHKMKKLGLDLNDLSSPEVSSTVGPEEPNSQEKKEFDSQRHIQTLAHACQCNDVNCCVPRCGSMKRTIIHTTICNRKAEGSCHICKNFNAINVQRACAIVYHGFLSRSGRGPASP